MLRPPHQGSLLLCNQERQGDSAYDEPMRADPGHGQHTQGEISSFSRSASSPPGATAAVTARNAAVWKSSALLNLARSKRQNKAHRYLTEGQTHSPWVVTMVEAVEEKCIRKLPK